MLSYQKVISIPLLCKFLSAVQKLVIKDVVAYADKKINKTKEIINT